MELKYLHEFITLAENGNFLDAAEELFISQSTLSKHIKALEKELNISLFERTTRRVRISEDGKIFLPYAVHIVQLQKECMGILQTRSATRTGKITLASTSQMVQYSVTDALAQYKRTHLSDKLDVMVEPHKNLKKLLLQHKADFVWIGETSTELRDESFIRLPFLDDPLVALFPTQQLSPGVTSVSMQDLKDLNVVMQDNSSVEQQIFLDACQKNGVELSITSIPGGKMMADFVRQGIGTAIMLHRPAMNFLCDEISLVKIQNSPIIHVSLIYPKNAKLSTAAKRFLEFIQQWKLETERSAAEEQGV